MLDLSKIVGEYVNHKAFGRGRIIKSTSTYFVVRFKTKTNANFDCKYIFPDVFLDNQMLVTTDSELIKSYLIKRSDQICSKCGAFVSYKLLPKQHMLCKQCFKKMVVCRVCKQLVEKNDCVKDKYNYIVCKKCKKKQEFCCSNCKKILPIWDRVESSYIPKDRPLCHDCADSMGYILCDICHEEFPEESEVRLNSFIMCPRCAEPRIAYCSRCGKLTHKTDNGQEPLCDDCERFKKYHKYVNMLNFEQLKIKVISYNILCNSRTTHLMSQVRASADKNPKADSIDILLVETSNGALVICYDSSDNFTHLCSSSRTLSRLKKNGISHLFHEKTCKVYSQRFVDVFNKVFYVWEYPYGLRAQTVYDRDYGNRWEDGSLYEGNYYGDTSNFLILGYIK